MKKKLVLMSCAILFLGSVFAQQQRVKFTEFKLKNGLDVILHQDNSTPIVAVSVLYHVGSKNEVAGHTGFAHFFEHLMFEGSKYIGRGEYFKTVLNAGGELNANTSFDRTYYYEVLPSNQLELGLWMESERMLHLKIDSIGVETQRAVVKEERKQSYENRPYGTILEKTFANAFKVHPYQWTPIGYPEDINKATLKEFMEFHSIYYVPNNATLCIAGDIDEQGARKLVEKYFGDIPAGTKPIYRPSVVEPVKTQEVREIVYDNIQLPAVIMSYHIPAQGTEDYYALSMLGTLLSGGESSRLNKALVDQQQKALQVMSFPFPSEDPGLMLMFGICNMGVSADDLEKGMDMEIEKFKKDGLSPKEFEKLRNQVESNFVKSSSSMEQIAENLSNYKVYYGDANLINTELDRYLKVTSEDLKRVAQKYLTKENRVVLHYLSKADKK